MTPKNILSILFIFATTVIAAPVVFTSCNPPVKNSPAYTSPLSTDDISDVVTAGITANSNGIAQEASAITIFLANMNIYTTTPSLPCNGSKDTAFSRAANATGVIYTYTGDWNCQLSCLGGVPDSIKIGQSMNGNFSHANLSGADGSAATLIITGLQAASPTITINGTYTRTGTDTSKVRNNTTYSSGVTYTLINVVVNKSSKQITGGSGTFVITGYSKGVAYQDSGVLTFSNTNSASITFDGTAYNFAMY